MEKLVLVMTCESHPEQYDVYRKGEAAPFGYVRMRYHFVSCQHYDEKEGRLTLGPMVYLCRTVGHGHFFSADERAFHLNACCSSLLHQPPVVGYPISLDFTYEIIK